MEVVSLYRSIGVKLYTPHYRPKLDPGDNC